jgi:hypothetical protein
MDARTQGTWEARSYYDEEHKQHFAVLPPGNDKLSRIAIPCSVNDLTEAQFTALQAIYVAIGHWEDRYDQPVRP